MEYGDRSCMLGFICHAESDLQCGCTFKQVMTFSLFFNLKNKLEKGWYDSLDIVIKVGRKIKAGVNGNS